MNLTLCNYIAEEQLSCQPLSLAHVAVVPEVGAGVGAAGSNGAG